MTFTFYLGTHQPHWLERSTAPLFVSHRRLAGRKKLPVATTDWALDSGGFTELKLYGRWTVDEDEYCENVERFLSIGRMQWAAPQDWMCEPDMLARTGLSVREHQERTVQNYLNLRSRAPHLPFVPTLQGYTLAEYQHCAELYQSAGVDLESLALVAIGSVCRRQQTQGGREVVQHFSRRGLRLHAFGLKVDGVAEVAYLLASSDSMAWSDQARWHAFRAKKTGGRGAMLPHCTHSTCSNCFDWAHVWRERVQRVASIQQPHLDLV